MAVTRYAPTVSHVFQGLSSDGKPEGLAASYGDRFLEVDTLKVCVYLNNSVGWTEFATLTSGTAAVAAGLI